MNFLQFLKLGDETNPLGINQAKGLSLKQINYSDKLKIKKDHYYVSRGYLDTKKNSPQLSRDLERSALRIERAGGISIPRSRHYKIYENKVQVYKLFKRAGIKYPETFYLKNQKELDDIIPKIKYPIIIKHPFSCSSYGIDQILDISDPKKLKTDLKKKLLSKKSKFGLIIQRKLNFTREARLTFIGDNLFHGYFRIKKSENAVSGASNHGSMVSFEINLEKFRPYVQDFVQKTGMDCGGIDVVWENDDFTQIPYALEVSPIFDLNPKYTGKETYKWFKTSMRNEYLKGRHDYFRKFGRLTREHLENRKKLPILFCDIDATINNHVERIQKFRYRGKDGKWKIDKKAYSTKEVLLDLPLDGSVSANHNLYKKYRIYFVTSRNQYEKAYETTRNWLIKYNFFYDRLVIVGSLNEKVKFMQKYLTQYISGENLFIDDMTLGHENEEISINTKGIELLNQEKINFVRFSGDWSKTLSKI